MNSSTVVTNLKYRKPGTCPPVFVAGTFTNPPWEPHEMEWTIGEDGEHTFVKTFAVDSKTEVQYKFRIGYGDWWVLCEESPTTTDAAGNVNNVLTPEANPLAKPPIRTPTEDPGEHRVPDSVEDTVQAPVHDQVQDAARDGVHRSRKKSSEENWGFQDELIVSSGNNTEADHGNGDSARDGVETPSSMPGEIEDGYFKPISNQLPEEETQETDSGPSTGQRKKVPSPAPVQATQEHEIVRHGESGVAKSREVPMTSDEAKDVAVLYPCPPIEPIKAPDEAATWTKDPQGRTEPLGSIASTATETPSSSPSSPSRNQASRNKQEAEANEVDPIGSRSESASEGTASTAVEAAEPEAEPELRRRRHGAKHEDSNTPLPCLPDPDDQKEQRHAANWLWSLVDWICGLFRGFFAWIV